MKDKVSIFIPVRSGSERVINKNVRDFAGVSGGLLHLKIKTVLEIEGVDEIVLSTNDIEAIKIAQNFNDDRLRIDNRPHELCQSSTLVSDLIRYVPTILNNEHIFWIHVTSPFTTAATYNSALKLYFDNLKNTNLDSLLSVTKIQQFIWDDEIREMINYDISKGNWPRTQDLKPLYEINHAFYINSKDNYIKQNNRVSSNMAIYILDKLNSFDIDWEDDFQIAETIYKSLEKLDL